MEIAGSDKSLRHSKGRIPTRTHHDTVITDEDMSRDLSAGDRWDGSRKMD